MGFMDKLKEFVAPIEDDDEDEVMEETVTATVQPQPAKAAQPAPQPAVQQSTYERPAKRTATSNLSANTKMVLFEPRSFGEAEEVGTRLKEGRAVVVNLHKLDREYAQRTIDFLTGVVFALDGNIQKIGQNVILCYPAEIGVSGTITLGNDEEEAPVVDDQLSVVVEE